MRVQLRKNTSRHRRSFYEASMWVQHGKSHSMNTLSWLPLSLNKSWLATHSCREYPNQTCPLWPMSAMRNSMITVLNVCWVSRESYQPRRMFVSISVVVSRLCVAKAAWWKDHYKGITLLWYDKRMEMEPDYFPRIKSIFVPENGGNSCGIKPTLWLSDIA